MTFSNSVTIMLNTNLLFGACLVFSARDSGSDMAIILGISNHNHLRRVHVVRLSGSRLTLTNPSTATHYYETVSSCIPFVQNIVATMPDITRDTHAKQV